MRRLLLASLVLALVACADKEGKDGDTVGAEIADDYNRQLDKAEQVEEKLDEASRRIDEAIESADQAIEEADDPVK